MFQKEYFVVVFFKTSHPTVSAHFKIMYLSWKKQQNKTKPRTDCISLLKWVGKDVVGIQLDISEAGRKAALFWCKELTRLKTKAAVLNSNTSPSLHRNSNWSPVYIYALAER